MRVPSEGDQVALRSMVDTIGVYETACLLTAVCADVAGHQADPVLGIRWRSAALALSAASDEIVDLGL